MMASKANRRQLLASAAALVALAGCARLEPGPASSPPSEVPSPPPSLTPTPTPTPTPWPVAPNLPEGLVNVLIAGSDSRTDNLNDNARADVICVAQLNADRTRINLVSIARDTVATMPSGRSSKINEAYSIGGIRALAEAVSGRLDGLPIHFTLETGFTWFSELSMMLGGFTVDNRISSSQLGPVFPAGWLTLQGDDALAYARERYGLPNGDLDRTERHRACLTGIVDRLGKLARADDHGLAELAVNLWSKVRPGGLVAQDAVALIPKVADMTRDSVASAMLPVARFGTVSGQSVDIIDADRAAELLGQLNAGDISAYQARYGLNTSPTGGRG